MHEMHKIFSQKERWFNFNIDFRFSDNIAMRKRLPYIFSGLFFVFLILPVQNIFGFELPAPSSGPGYLPVGINLPDGVTAASGAYSSSLDINQKLEKRFGDFLQTFATHYGRAILLSLHAMNPVGQDNLGQYPGFVVGFNVVAAFSNTNPILDSAKISNIGISSAILPYPVFAFNLGLGITKKFDIRLTFWPPVTFEKKLSNFNTKFTMGSIQLKFGYHVLEGGRLKPGITISGTLGYSHTKLTFNSSAVQTQFNGVNNQNNLVVTGGGTADITYTTKALLENQVNYFTGSAEIKFWYDLVFVAPYVGYSLDFNSGKFAALAAIDAHTTISYSGTNYESNTRFKTEKVVHPQAVGHRFTVGLQIKIYVFHLTTEMQIDLGNRILSGGVSTSFKF